MTTTTTTTKPGLAVCPFIILINLFLYMCPLGQVLSLRIHLDTYLPRLPLMVTVHCLLNQAPAYLADRCVPISNVAGRRHPRSAARHQLTVPCNCHINFDTRAFATAVPTVWSSLPDYLRHPLVQPEQFRRDMKVESV